MASSDQDLGTSTFSCLKMTLPGVVGDFGGAPFPFDLVEGLDLGIAEDRCSDAERFPSRRTLFLELRVAADQSRTGGGRVW